jgi:TolB protein
MYIWYIQGDFNSQPFPNRRQPDFNLYNQLAANAEGNGLDNLIKMGANGEDPWVISEHPEDAHPHWSPDGKMVVFDSSHMGDRNHRIYLQRDTDHRRELPPMTFEAWELFGRYPIFIADGRVAYNGCNWWENGSVCGIYLVDTNGGKPSVATAWPGDLPTDNLGAEIVFMSDRSGNWDVYRMAADGSNLRRLTESSAVEGPATVSPDGAHIAFLTNRDGVWAIHVMQSDGSNRRELFKLNGGFGGGEHDWLQERLSWGN